LAAIHHSQWTVPDMSGNIALFALGAVISALGVFSQIEFAEWVRWVGFIVMFVAVSRQLTAPWSGWTLVIKLKEGSRALTSTSSPAVLMGGELLVTVEGKSRQEIHDAADTLRSR
jgi:hypothetical protein